MVVGAVFFSFIVVLSKGRKAWVNGRSIVDVRTIVSCVRDRLSKGLRLRAITRTIRCSGCRLRQLFARAMKVAVRSCIRHHRLARTTGLLIFSSGPVVRVTFVYKCRDRRSFSLTFGTVCGSPPTRCHRRQDFCPLRLQFVLRQEAATVRFAVRSVQLTRGGSVTS